MVLPGRPKIEAKPTDKKTVLIYPKDKSEGNFSRATKELVKMCLDPIKMGLKVKRISKKRNAGVAIELKDSTSLDTLSQN